MLFGGDIRVVGTETEVAGSVSGYGRGVVRDASMKARIRRSRYKFAGSTVEGNTVLTNFDGERSPLGVEDPESSHIDIDEGRVEGKLVFRESIASSMRPERMLT
jgi:hypothetical protein